MKNYTSKIGFSISIPKNWKIDHDDLTRTGSARKLQEVYFEAPSPLSGKRDPMWLEDPFFQEQYFEDGYFTASPPWDSFTEEEGFPIIKVTKLRLERPMTASELEKRIQITPGKAFDVRYPSRGDSIDGKEVQRSSYLIGGGVADRAGHMRAIRFDNAYLTVGTTGWVISCSCLESAWSKYESLFNTIINSFKIL